MREETERRQRNMAAIEEEFGRTVQEEEAAEGDEGGPGKEWGEVHERDGEAGCLHSCKSSTRSGGKNGERAGARREKRGRDGDA